MYTFQVEDTDRWRSELASLAAASGLGLGKDEKKANNHLRTATADQQNASRSGAHYSARTGRFNEGASKSRGRTGSKHATPFTDTFFNVQENERELWVNSIFLCNYFYLYYPMFRCYKCFVNCLEQVIYKMFNHGSFQRRLLVRFK